jgi:hypothetical protein
MNYLRGIESISGPGMPRKAIPVPKTAGRAEKGEGRKEKGEGEGGPFSILPSPFSV